MRGVNSARGQDSSVGGVAVVVSLGAVDMEERMQVREQVDCEREKVEVGEIQERDKQEETTNARSNM